LSQLFVDDLAKQTLSRPTAAERGGEASLYRTCSSGPHSAANSTRNAIQTAAKKISRATQKKHLQRRGESDAPERGGPPRSSDEGSVMELEPRGWVTAVEVGSPGYGRNPTFNGRRQPSCGGTSRMMREYQVRNL